MKNGEKRRTPSSGEQKGRKKKVWVRKKCVKREKWALAVNEKGGG
jgi:hypothetical protein